MKKIFTLLCSAAALMASATDYTAPMVVELNDVYNEPSSATITLDETDGTYTFSLNNFIFSMGDTQMPIGNIVATGVPGKVVDGVITIDAEAHATCTAGDIEGVTWMGPILLMMGVDLEIEAIANDTEMVAMMDMDITGVGDIEVYFGAKLVDMVLSATETISYDEPLAVDLNGNLIPQGNAVINLTEIDSEDDSIDDTYTLELKNFVFSMGTEGTLYFGNIVVEGLKAVDDEGDFFINFDTEATAYFTEGDLEGVPFWMGPSFGSTPVKIKATASWLGMEAILNLSITGVGDIIVYYGESTVASAGINTVIIDNTTDAPIYNLQGIPVTNPTAGQIYIQNGKKLRF